MVDEEAGWGNKSSDNNTSNSNHAVSTQSRSVSMQRKNVSGTNSSARQQRQPVGGSPTNITQRPATATAPHNSLVQRQANDPGTPQQQQQMRQRRRRIESDLKRDKREMQNISKHLKRSAQNDSSQRTKLAMVIGTAVIVTLMAASGYARPRFLYGPARTKIRPYQLATLYPSNINIERDLPRFFRTLAIATPSNREARDVVGRTLRSRTHLLEAGVKTHVKPFDQSQVIRYLNRNLCGPDFRAAYYQESNFVRQQDLVMWCLLTTRVAEGFFWQDLEMLDSAILLTQGRGMAAIRQPSVDEPGIDRISSSWFLVPRINRDSNSTDPLAVMPSQMLTWVLSNKISDFEDEKDYRAALEDYLYRLVELDGHDHYMMLDIECHPIEYQHQTIKKYSDRAIARQCDTSQCCEYVVPERYGGRFRDEDSSDD